MIDSLTDGFFLDTVIGDAGAFLHLLDSRSNVICVKAVLLSFFQQTDQITFYSFFSKKEAVFKDLGLYILDLIFLNQMSQLISD